MDRVIEYEYPIILVVYKNGGKWGSEIYQNKEELRTLENDRIYYIAEDRILQLYYERFGLDFSKKPNIKSHGIQ